MEAPKRRGDASLLAEAANRSLRGDVRATERRHGVGRREVVATLGRQPVDEITDIHG